LGNENGESACQVDEEIKLNKLSLKVQDKSNSLFTDKSLTSSESDKLGLKKRDDVDVY